MARMILYRSTDTWLSRSEIKARKQPKTRVNCVGRAKEISKGNRGMCHTFRAPVIPSFKVQQFLKTDFAAF